MILVLQITPPRKKAQSILEEGDLSGKGSCIQKGNIRAPPRGRRSRSALVWSRCALVLEPSCSRACEFAEFISGLWSRCFTSTEVVVVLVVQQLDLALLLDPQLADLQTSLAMEQIAQAVAATALQVEQIEVLESYLCPVGTPTEVVDPSSAELSLT
ncbi:hypothetical protein Taro_016456 [Colocasia esculenta]|uniref:Uncharacterized protein n=1 Tax=Colocasia esculenta TaxID=4460 RepID=A0A843UKS2_COLES|nr:hypothetical protein [Colocasia esculenta]